MNGNTPAAVPEALPQAEPVIVTRDDVAAGLRRLGIGAGDTVFFHSSLKSLGRVTGGPDAVLGGLLDAVGPAGTLVAPTFTLTERLGPFGSWYHYGTTPSTVGLLTETLRRRPDAIRSFHSIHSVAAIGRLARLVTAGHASAFGRVSPWCDAAFAQGSPLDLLTRWNAWYILLGVTFNVQTLMHYVEAMLVDGTLRRASGAERDRLAAGVRRWGSAGGIWPHINRVPLGELLAGSGAYIQVTIGSATVYGERFQTVLAVAVRQILSDPERWLNQPFREWMGPLLDPATLLAEYTAPAGGAPLALPTMATSCVGHGR